VQQRGWGQVVRSGGVTEGDGGWEPQGGGGCAAGGLRRGRAVGGEPGGM